MDKINGLLKETKENKQIKLWKSFDIKEQHKIIYKMYSNGKCDKNICNLVVNILTNLSQQDKPEIGPKYVNLLCILLAKTHNKKYLPVIILCKYEMDTDYCVNIDSTLLFEFSPGKKRESCVKDTLNEKLNDSLSNKKWYLTYRSQVENLATLFKNESIRVVKMWNHYKTQEFKDQMYEYIKYM